MYGSDGPGGDSGGPGYGYGGPGGGSGALESLSLWVELETSLPQTFQEVQPIQ